MNAIANLRGLGQSVWLDYIRRGLISSGELKRMVEEDGLAGVTSNPAIFEKAIVGSKDYVDLLEELRAQKTWSIMALYEEVAIRDIRDAADVLMPVYESTNGRDGYVSLEVSPYLADNTRKTIEEARRLWRTVDRKNLMLKVPGTEAGIPAVEELIGEGININVTLLFSREMYVRVAEAYIAGLERYGAQGGEVSRVGSVASFFVSRIDSAVDAIVAERMNDAGEGERSLLESITGKVAIANARLTYQRYGEIFAGERWRALSECGANPQRVLWASTGTKNPAYSDVLYVEELIGPETVNTLPPATYNAFKDHGKLRPSLEEGVDEAARTITSLEQLGISMEEITGKLLEDGVRLFSEAFDKLLNSLDRECLRADRAPVNELTYHLPEGLALEVEEMFDAWQIEGMARRLWACDSSVWTGADEGEWLGWLETSEQNSEDFEHLEHIAAEVRNAGFSKALLLGMGGSSLCPEVLSRVFDAGEGYPELRVLDSTDPNQIRSIEETIDLDVTLFIVASKSGTTLEPNILKDYFFDRVRDLVDSDDPGQRFLAITDPGSKLQEAAQHDRFRYILLGLQSVGGRYSALSNFGMTPAAIMGLDIERFLGQAGEMANSCSACRPIRENPGAVLGMVLGVCGRNGFDKVTLMASPGLREFGAWVEQLLAESTGKVGKGLIPIENEPMGPPELYGDDRIFVYTRLCLDPVDEQDSAIEALIQAGYPVVRIDIPEVYGLGQEFFRWMFATAVAGSVMGINPFDQPDVEASKLATRKMMNEFDNSGALPADDPIIEENGISLFADTRNAAVLREMAGEDQSLTGYLRSHLGRIEKGDYFALLAYLERSEPHRSRLREIRQAVQEHKKVATCLGFGPRFLHSTGQAYKGGPNSGVFLQITCDDPDDIPVPGKSYTFGVVKAAQARGDFRVLGERDRRALRIHLGPDVESGLIRLAEVCREVL
jgi:transaldolase/glucose-6-phosphate isomerase